MKKEVLLMAPGNIHTVSSTSSPLKDSGLREQLTTGAMREPAVGRGRYDLISPVLLKRLAVHYENGALKYKERNWEKGILASRMFSSTIRHLYQWLAGDTSEDHLAAAMWNIGCIAHFEELMPSMIDVDSRPEYEHYLVSQMNKEIEEKDGVSMIQVIKPGLDTSSDNNKVVVLVSGGLDSAVLLAAAVNTYGVENITALNMHYGQKHEIENECFADLMTYYNIPEEAIVTLDLSAVFAASDCPLLSASNKELPQGDYADQETDENGVVKTYVPFRNGVFLSVATSVAYARGASIVLYGAHADDAMGNAYPDCGADFIAAMDHAVMEGTSGAVWIAAPFQNLHKHEIVAIGIEEYVPFELTWSCYEGNSGDRRACGTCGTCVDRKKAFAANNMTDPVTYK